MKRTPSAFIALDGLVKKEPETLAMASLLAEVQGDFGFKFNLDYILAKTLKGAVRELSGLGRPLFADFKMWNGERTMADIVAEAVDLGIDYINVYALADRAIRKAAEIAAPTKTILLGLTVLSHYDDDYCRLHFRRTFAESVRHMADVSLEYGCRGIILPGTNLEAVANLKTLKMATGIRPSWYSDNRHEQEIEPAVAFANGADIIVCGSPIMKVPDPIQALRRILSERPPKT